jgi:hypothetical protein
MLKIASKYLVVFLVLHTFSSVATAQEVGDTIVVQTLNYASTTRDTMVVFPDFSGLTFEKVLMRYNMRCKDAAVNTSGGNNVACGEWDYSCNTYLTDSTRTDSLGTTHPDFVITGFSGAIYNYTTTPTYSYFQSTQQEVTYTEVLSEVVSEIGNGLIPNETPLKNSLGDAKTQYLYTADELTSGGLAAGVITGLTIDIGTLGDEIANLRIGLKETNATELDPASPEIDGFTNVYYLNTTFDAEGEHQFNLSTEFGWDGASNLIVQFTYKDADGSGSEVLSETIENHGLASASDDFYLDFNGESYVELENSFPQVTDQITISCWVYGNEDVMPSNTTLFEGRDLDNNRQVNAHLPWGNSRVYWDCGNDGAGYDRIDKEAALEDFAGKWNHWAFTKNATSGSMKIYLNGSLWHSGNGKTKLIDLQELRIGRSITWTNTYFGKVDEFRVWNTELSASEIADYMYSPVSESHPSYANLMAYYTFDQGVGDIAEDMTGNHEGVLVASPLWRQNEGQEIRKNFSLVNERPNIKIIQGEYITSVVETVVLDSTINAVNTVTEYGVNGTDLEEISVNTYYEAGDMPIIDESGDQVGLVNVPAENSIEIGELFYYRKFPMKYEIMSFVTPYGIGLDMTPVGKTWTFDLTDFVPILNGSKRMTLERGGQWQEEMDIQFLFVVGTPPRDVIDIQQIWKVDQRNYSVISDDTFFPPRDVMTNPQGSQFKVRSAITGHGQQGEFIPRTHYVDINGGSNEFSWQVWKECAANPLYPQGGTWIYDRAGWCPGMATDVQEFDITSMVTPGETVNIDYGMNSATGDSRYIVNHQLVTYGDNNFGLDASIVEVRKPSDRFEFDRFGTICHSPEVVIRNTGSETLTSVTITYWVNNATTPETYIWTGSLEFLESETVVLPTPESLWQAVTPENNVFHASISLPNGEVDEYDYNNTYESSFQIPEVVPSHFLIIFSTNTQANENDYQLRDDNGSVIFQRDNMSPNTLYRDTLQLPIGCYTFHVNDSDDDGVSFWANNDGNGSVRLKEVGGPTFKYFEGDFGDAINYEFTVDYPLKFDEVAGKHQFEVFPNPTRDQLSLSLEGFDTNVLISIYNSIGQLVLSQRVITGSNATVNTLSMRSLESGVYVVQASDGTRVATQRVVKE